MVRGDRRGRLLRSETPAMAGPSCPEGWAARLSHGHHRDYLAGMSLPPDQPPSPKPKVSAEERRARQDDRLKCIRLRMAARSWMSGASPLPLRSAKLLGCR